MIQGKEATYLYSATTGMPKLDLKREPKTVYIFSACEKPGISLDIGGLRPGKYAWESRDCHMRSVSKGQVETTDGRLSWDAPVPSGGLIELRVGVL